MTAPSPKPTAAAVICVAASIPGTPLDVDQAETKSSELHYCIPSRIDFGIETCQAVDFGCWVSKNLGIIK